MCLSAVSVETPACLPSSTLPFLTRSCRVSAVQPILVTIDITLMQRKGWSPSPSSIIRTAAVNGMGAGFRLLS